ncbi:hypothetical protein EYF80_058317 [Liparis tanakae]|uniref:Uncharacterized protein n=1 Tax=Liparis tanakae TaxID=230148 RepID=A0A4Z2ETB8_9TELE|nr:hypothetical protein EYF80_058317 [Liparis tanakae]
MALDCLRDSARLHHQLGYRCNVQTYRQTDRQTERESLSNQTNGSRVTFCSVFCSRLTGVGGELQAARTQLRLDDRLQEGGVLDSGELGGQLAHVARHEIRLLVANQEGDRQTQRAVEQQHVFPWQRLHLLVRHTRRHQILLNQRVHHHPENEKESERRTSRGCTSSAIRQQHAFQIPR